MLFHRFYQSDVKKLLLKDIPRVIGRKYLENGYKMYFVLRPKLSGIHRQILHTRTVGSF